MNFIEKHKKGIIISLSLLCIVFIIFTTGRKKPTPIENSLGFILTPVQEFNHNVYTWFADRIFIFKNYNEMKKENEYLKNIVYSLEAKNKESELIKKENEELNELLKLKSKYKDYSTIGAQIIAKDPGNWYDIFIINKGSKDGIKKNMVVITTDGLVGRIIESGYNYSKVTSIIDDSNSVSGKTLRTGDIGYVRGDLSNKGMCLMEYIDTEAEIIEGDEIVTSHLSDIYPPGLTIGYVKEISFDNNNLSKKAIIEPTVDFKHLETVLIINQLFDKDITVSETEKQTNGE